MKEEYLGDGLYASWDGAHGWKGRVLMTAEWTDATVVSEMHR